MGFWLEMSNATKVEATTDRCDALRCPGLHHTDALNKFAILPEMDRSSNLSRCIATEIDRIDHRYY